MPTSSKPRKAASSKPKKGVSSASAWKKKKRDSTHELELPSGEVCRVVRPGMETLIADNIFSDSLLPMIQEQIDAAQGKKTAAPLDEQQLLKDPKAIADIMTAYDKVVAKCVVEPKCLYHKREVTDAQGKTVWEEIPDEERDEEKIYTDEVDLEDKIFIFQYVVGGSSDLATFRQQFREGVAALPDGEGVSVSS